MNEEHPSKRQRQCPSDEQILEGLDVLLDWLEQFPSETTCNIILVSPMLRYSSRLCSLQKGLRKPRLNIGDVSLANLSWFSSFPKKCMHSFGEAAAKNGDLPLLKHIFTHSFITPKFYRLVANHAIKQDNLLLLCWARGFNVETRSAMKAVRYTELKLAITHGAINTLVFLAIPDALGKCFTHTFSIHKDSFIWLERHYPNIWRQQKSKSSHSVVAALAGNLELLKYLRGSGFQLEYGEIYVAAATHGHSHIMQWAHEMLFIEGETQVPPLFRGPVESIETFLRHHPKHASKLAYINSTSLDVCRLILKASGKLPRTSCCELILAGKSKEISSLNFKVVIEDLHHPDLWVVTPEQMQFLLNAGLELDQRLFDFALHRMSVDICKLLRTLNDNLLVRWPSEWHEGSYEKWTWLDSVVPFDSAYSGQFAAHCLRRENIDSFRWAVEKLPESELSAAMETVKWSPKFATILYARYPHLPEECFLDPFSWERDEIKFLVANRYTIKIPHGFCPNWPDDFEFYSVEHQQLDWTYSKKAVLKQVSTNWSEVNFQHFLNLP